MGALKDMITNRAAQLIARYIGVGLVALATRIGAQLTPDQVNGTIEVAGALAAALLMFAYDHFTHTKINEKAVDAEIDARIDSGMLRSWVLFACLGLTTLTGCTQQQYEQAGTIAVNVTTVAAALFSKEDQAILDQITSGRGIEDTANRAVCFGDNYPGTTRQLRGCVYDAQVCAINLCKCYGFKPNEIHLVIDADCTRANMWRWMQWALADAKPGDKRAITNSSHGAQDASLGGEGEPDHLHEVWVPFDFDWSPEKEITDRQVYELLATVDEGVNYFILNDSCNSGGAARQGVRNKSLTPPASVATRIKGAKHTQWRARIDGLRGTYLAGCKSNQLSADAYIDGQYRGAFTYNYWNSAKPEPRRPSTLAIRDTVQSMRNGGFSSQTPQAEGEGSNRIPFE